jgi:hypothetical protein
MIGLSSGRLAAAAVLLATSTASATAERATHDGEWNVTRATLAAGSPLSPTQITLVRGIATRDDIAMQDGTIDVDLDAPSQDQFAGLVFRAANTANYEIVYFSAEKGRWRDVQYQPFFDGSPSWQLYNGPGYRAELSPAIVPADRPMHVRIVIAVPTSISMGATRRSCAFRSSSECPHPDASAFGLVARPRRT